jgi:hypothetical protein
MMNEKNSNKYKNNKNIQETEDNLKNQILTTTIFEQTVIL